MKVNLANMGNNRPPKKIVVLSDLRRKNEELEKECAFLRRRVNSIAETNKELENRLNDVKAIVARLRDDLANTKEDNAALRRKKSI